MTGSDIAKIVYDIDYGQRLFIVARAHVLDN